MKFFIVVFIMLLSFTMVTAQSGDKKVKKDAVYLLAGTWQMTGHVMNQPVVYRAEGKWILDHQFFRFTMEDVQEPPEYQAQVFIGYDSSKTNYIVHWLDVFGGEYSRTLGFGKVDADSVRIVFAYQNRPFRDTIMIAEEQNSGEFLIEYKTPNGEWKEFARYKMKKVK